MIGKPVYDYCKLELSPYCHGKNGFKSLIVNKSRGACHFCNEWAKAEIKAKKQAGKVETKKEVKRLNLQIQDQKFYRKVWELHHNQFDGCYCEECGKFLPNYSASYISHIISRGAETRLRHDERNINILCLQHHQQWETGNRQSMAIWKKNQPIIDILHQSLIKEK